MIYTAKGLEHAMDSLDISRYSACVIIMLVITAKARKRNDLRRIKEKVQKRKRIR